MIDRSARISREALRDHARAYVPRPSPRGNGFDRVADDAIDPTRAERARLAEQEREAVRDAGPRLRAELIAAGLIVPAEVAVDRRFDAAVAGRAYLSIEPQPDERPRRRTSAPLAPDEALLAIEYGAKALATAERRDTGRRP